MKRVLTILSGLLSALCVYAQADSLRIDTALLERYCGAIVSESDSVQCAEADWLVSSCEDPVQRSQTANWLYNHYRNSKIMGAETMAVHIFDRWFASGELRMQDDVSYLGASIFCDFNRASLTGCRAPSFTACSPDGETVEIDFGGGRPAVLYFYSTSCAKCKVENVLLRNVIENRDAPVDVFTVCTSDDKAAREKILEGPLNFSVSSTRVFHLSDNGDRDWQKKYGVLQTPRLFLIDSEGVIIGRSLDAFALDKLLEEMFRPVEMNYGSEESMAFYDGLFASYVQENGSLASSNVEAVAEHIAMRTLEETKDTLMFKQLTGDLLYYLNGRSEQALRNAVSPFIEKQILARPEIWSTADDSLKILGLGAIMKELGDRALPGSKVPGITVRGKVYRNGKFSGERAFRLDRLPRKVEYIFFHSPLCSSCAAQMEAIGNASGQVLCVNLDEIEEKNAACFSSLADSFDLTIMPVILKVRDGRIAERYCSFIQ